MYFRTYTNSYKALLVCIISFFLTFSPSLVFATTVADSGWSVSKQFVKGATTFYNASKDVIINGKKVAATSAAAIAPNASQVAKMIVRTGATAAVTVAIQELLGAVDYVLDPENNRVKYFVTPETNPQFLYGPSSDLTASSAYGSCQKMNAANGNGSSWIGNISFDASRGRYGYCVGENYPNGWQINQYPNPAYDPAHKEEKSIPYESVASQIINDAEAENADAKAYVSSVADTALDSDESRQLVPSSTMTQQLNGAEALPTTEAAAGTATPTADPADPTAPKAPPTDIKLNFPVFCSWAPTVCQAAQAAIEFPKTAAGWWKTLDTWLTSLVKDDVTEPEQPDYEIEEPDLNLGVQQYISGPAFCPEDRHIPLSMGGQSLDIIISYSALCTVAQQFRPAVILMSFLAGAFIITNTGRRAETGD
ncbi:virulence factor TspB C-terminal domain-related protein [Acinetobacter seifertii]|uniref:virulence factor TspB C-terminal domain-related protein n=1 Tax=Acinetobacter seifertii TaxID=1530123 RepID=UPI0032B49647